MRHALAELQDDYGQVTTDLDTLVTLVRRQHDDGHPDAFQFCQSPVCHYAARVAYDPNIRPFL